MRDTDLKNYNKILTSGRCYTKYTKDSHILNLVGVDQKIAYNSNKSSEKSNRDPTKGDTSYTRDLPPWVPEYPKGGVGNKNKDRKEYWWCKE